MIELLSEKGHLSQEPRDTIRTIHAVEVGGGTRVSIQETARSKALRWDRQSSGSLGPVGIKMGLSFKHKETA